MILQLAMAVLGFLAAAFALIEVIAYFFGGAEFVQKLLKRISGRAPDDASDLANAAFWAQVGIVFVIGCLLLAASVFSWRT